MQYRPIECLLSPRLRVCGRPRGAALRLRTKNVAVFLRARSTARVRFARLAGGRLRDIIKKIFERQIWSSNLFIAVADVKQCALLQHISLLESLQQPALTDSRVSRYNDRPTSAATDRRKCSSRQLNSRCLPTILLEAIGREMRDIVTSGASFLSSVRVGRRRRFWKWHNLRNSPAPVEELLFGRPKITRSAIAAGLRNWFPEPYQTIPLLERYRAFKDAAPKRGKIHIAVNPRYTDEVMRIACMSIRSPWTQHHKTRMPRIL